MYLFENLRLYWICEFYFIEFILLNFLRMPSIDWTKIAFLIRIKTSIVQELKYIYLIVLFSI